MSSSDTASGPVRRRVKRKITDTPVSAAFAEPYPYFRGYRMVVYAKECLRTPVFSKEKIPGETWENHKQKYEYKQTGEWKKLDDGCLELYFVLCCFADDRKSDKPISFYLTELAYKLNIDLNTLKKRIDQIYYARLVDVEWGDFVKDTGRHSQTHFVILAPEVAVRNSLLVTGRIQPEDPTPITFAEIEPFRHLDMAEGGLHKSYHIQRKDTGQLVLPVGLFNADGTLAPPKPADTPPPAPEPQPAAPDIPPPLVTKRSPAPAAASGSPVRDSLPGAYEILASWRDEGDTGDHALLFLGSDTGVRGAFRPYCNLTVEWMRHRLPAVPSAFSDVDHVNEERMIGFECTLEQVGKRFANLSRKTGNDPKVGLVRALDHLMQENPHAIELVEGAAFPLQLLCMHVKVYLHNPPTPEPPEAEEDDDDNPEAIRATSAHLREQEENTCE